MRISRLYTADRLKVDQEIDLAEESAHYVRTVLRLKNSQALTLFNGLGGEFLCTLIEVSRKKVRVKIEEAIDRTVESPLKVILGLGISRGDKMDWSVQKSVELGVTNITPLITERCVVKFKEGKKQQRYQHWKKILQHAAEQSGRTVLPELNEINELQTWLKKQQGLRFFLDPFAEKTLIEQAPEEQKVTLLTGPEGGFSTVEKTLAIEAGFIPVRLGPRILRTETASLAAISAVQMLWGDYR
jgi:16S rRNA (uracil1498-N3)-methyltransferase